MKLSTKKLAICAALIALSYVLNNFGPKIHLPYSGSATLFSMLCLFLCGYFFGGKVGLFCGICYGCLDLLISPSIYHPLQVLLDYPLAFGAIGLGGFLNEKKYGLQLGYLIGITGRFIMSTISGAVFFGMYAPEGMNPWIYSGAYNATYIYGEGIITLIILMIPVVYKAINRLKTQANS